MTTFELWRREYRVAVDPDGNATDIIDDLVFREQSDSQAADRRTAYRLVVVGAERAMHRDIHRAIGPDQPPRRVARRNPMHDARMIRQLVDGMRADWRISSTRMTYRSQQSPFEPSGTSKSSSG